VRRHVLLMNWSVQMKSPSIGTWAWLIALASVLSAILLALGDAGLPDTRAWLESTGLVW
jgi:hypothetical protein